MKYEITRVNRNRLKWCLIVVGAFCWTVVWKLCVGMLLVLHCTVLMESENVCWDVIGVALHCVSRSESVCWDVIGVALHCVSGSESVCWDVIGVALHCVSGE